MKLKILTLAFVLMTAACAPGMMLAPHQSDPRALAMLQNHQGHWSGTTFQDNNRTVWAAEISINGDQIVLHERALQRGSERIADGTRCSYRIAVRYVDGLRVQGRTYQTSGGSRCYSNTELYLTPQGGDALLLEQFAPGMTERGVLKHTGGYPADAAVAPFRPQANGKTSATPLRDLTGKAASEIVADKRFRKLVPVALTKTLDRVVLVSSPSTVIDGRFLVFEGNAPHQGGTAQGLGVIDLQTNGTLIYTTTNGKAGIERFANEQMQRDFPTDQQLPPGVQATIARWAANLF